MTRQARALWVAKDEDGMPGSSPEPLTMGALLERHEGFLFDAYGVLVDNHGARPYASSLTEYLHNQGQPYAVVTNDASRRPETAARWFREQGLVVTDEQVISSGGLLIDFVQRKRLSQAPAVILGPPDSQVMGRLAGLEVRPWQECDDAEVLIIADEHGYPFVEAVDHVMSALARRARAGRPLAMVLPNPDIIYPTATGYGIASGSVAAILEAALDRLVPNQQLRFARLGKPEATIFEEALKRIGTREVVMVGDQLETDILGAQSCGLASALVCDGISPEARSRKFSAERPRPTYILESLALP